MAHHHTPQKLSRAARRARQRNARFTASRRRQALHLAARESDWGTPYLYEMLDLGMRVNAHPNGVEGVLLEELERRHPEALRGFESATAAGGKSSA